jgi:hypothetical protein
VNKHTQSDEIAHLLLDVLVCDKLDPAIQVAILLLFILHNTTAAAQTQQRNSDNIFRNSVWWYSSCTAQLETETLLSMAHSPWQKASQIRIIAKTNSLCPVGRAYLHLYLHLDAEIVIQGEPPVRTYRAQRSKRIGTPSHTQSLPQTNSPPPLRAKSPLPGWTLLTCICISTLILSALSSVKPVAAIGCIDLVFSETRPRNLTHTVLSTSNF